MTLAGMPRTSMTNHILNRAVVQDAQILLRLSKSFQPRVDCRGSQNRFPTDFPKTIQNQLQVSFITVVLINLASHVIVSRDLGG